MQKALKGKRTKQKLAGALKELLNTKPLDRVRIHELTELCDVHRQTFYYHFADIYALFTWCVEQEAEALSAWLRESPSWQEALRWLLRYAAENRGYFTAILDYAAGRQAFFDRVLAGVLEGRLSDGRESAVYRKSLSLMLLPLLEKWVRGELEQSPEEIIAFLESLVEARSLH